MKNKDPIIEVTRHKTSISKDGEVFEYYFVCEKGRNYIIGYEDANGNDVENIVEILRKNGYS